MEPSERTTTSFGLLSSLPSKCEATISRVPSGRSRTSKLVECSQTRRLMPAPSGPVSGQSEPTIERCASRWSIETHLGEQIRAFHLDALAAQVSLAVDFDTTLTVDRRRRLP
jgi:hypothetical protein